MNDERDAVSREQMRNRSGLGRGDGKLPSFLLKPPHQMQQVAMGAPVSVVSWETNKTFGRATADSADFWLGAT